MTPHTGFAYFHVNSLEKQPADGNYLVFARHTSRVYYINATDQSSSGASALKAGQAPSSRTSASNTRFVSQSQKGNISNVSIFDSAHNCYPSAANQPSGCYIPIDLDVKTATQTRRVTGLEGRILSCSQSDAQLLDNYHVFSG